LLFTDIIRKKRDGGELTPEEIAYFVDGLADGSIPAEQVAALAMAVFLNSMSAEEAGCLTLAMATSGSVLEWQDEGLDGPVVDKHSTGGVGDKVSFLVAPIAAVCGCYVPMISGRGLGHTGGTTDKVESIPGYNATPDFALFKKVVKSAGCAIIGQTADLAPHRNSRVYPAHHGIDSFEEDCGGNAGDGHGCEIWQRGIYVWSCQGGRTGEKYYRDRCNCEFKDTRAYYRHE
jgi:thymidine phosphorylase